LRIAIFFEGIKEKSSSEKLIGLFPHGFNGCGGRSSQASGGRARSKKKGRYCSIRVPADQDFNIDLTLFIMN